jgi:hypothetical protein
MPSPDFLASDYCYGREMVRAIERHEAGLTTVIPVILRPCDWRDAPFGGLLAVPKDGKPCGARIIDCSSLLLTPFQDPGPPCPDMVCSEPHRVVPRLLWRVSLPKTRSGGVAAVRCTSAAAPGLAGEGTGNRLAVTYRPIAELKLAPNNPRLQSRKQVRQIAQSIQAFGFNVPVLVDAQSNVVAGHGRVLACKELGLTEAPTIRLEHLTETQICAFRIADNRLTETSAWDDRLLAEQLKELSVVELDFTLEATGFDMGEAVASSDSRNTGMADGAGACELPPLRTSLPHADRAEPSRPI